MEYNLIYVDDEKGKRDAFADSLSQNSELTIHPCSPSTLEKTRDELIAKKKEIDGIILDLKLDGNQEGEDSADYTAPSLAQAIRSKFAEEGFTYEMPIFLLTSQDNLEKYYKYDLTSHDLFDFLFFKQKLGEENTYSNKIVSILKSYKIIKEKKKDLEKILGIDLKSLNNTIFPSKFYNPEQVTVYDISKFILRKIILRQGILISEEVLASRLGVDIEKSSDWNKLKDNFEKIKYKGIYTNVWERWWSHELINYWRELYPNEKSLIQLNAEERVKLLSEKFNLNALVTATPIEKASDTKFWTVCSVYKKPLDIRDGILIETSDSESWHDKLYISLQSILERDYKSKKIVIHPTETERVQELKQGY